MVRPVNKPDLRTIRKKAEETTFIYYQSGYTCAEAISKAVLELFHAKPLPIVPKIASAFSGGLGQSHEELCGALTGGVIVLACLLGRDGINDSLDDLTAAIMNFKRGVILEIGALNCGEILEQLGKQDDYHKCKKFTAKTAGVLVDTIVQYKK